LLSRQRTLSRPKRRIARQAHLHSASSDIGADVVALPIAPSVDVQLWPYEVDYLSHLRVQPSQRVNVIGFPFGERSGVSFAVWATGFIASEPEVDHSGKPVFLIDCRSREGQSGSPVILYGSTGAALPYEVGSEEASDAMRLLGIYSGRINKDSDLGVVWKTHAISELLDYASTL
jgi:hypothetical protein